MKFKVPTSSLGNGKLFGFFSKLLPSEDLVIVFFSVTDFTCDGPQNTAEKVAVKQLAA